MSNYLVGPGIAINQLFLILYLLFGEMLARIDFAVYLVHWLPFLMLTLLIRQFALAAWQPDPAAMGYHIRGASLVYGTWPVYTLALLSTVLGIRVPFIATPKEKRGGNYIGLVIPQIIVVLLLMLSIGWRIGHGFVDFDVIVMGLAGLSILMHGSVFYAVWEGFQIRAQQTHAEPVWGVPAVGQE